MIKSGIKKFLINLKYFFTPLGTLFLGIIFGISFLLVGVNVQFDYISKEITKISTDVSVSATDLKDCVINTFSNLDWSNPVKTIGTITSDEWINGTLIPNVESKISNFENYATEIKEIFTDASKGITTYFSMFIICTVLGLIGGFFLTKYFIRKSIANRTIFQTIFINIADILITATISTACAYFATLWQPSIIISGLIGLAIYGMITLYEAYLVHGQGVVEFHEIVNLKNITGLLVSDLAIFAIALALVALSILITNTLVGVFMAIPLATIAFIVVSLNAEAYVKQIVDAPEKKQKTQKTKKQKAESHTY